MRLLVFIVVCLNLSLLTSRINVEQRYLTKEKCLPLRAILPLLIILHHCSDFMGIPYIDADFGILGGAVVGIFFFFSGYGMEFKREKGLLKLTDLPSRISKLLYQLVIPTLLFYAVIYIYGNSISETFVKVLVGNFCTLPYSWFISTLCILYLLYHLASKLTEKYFFGCLIVFMFLLHIIYTTFNAPLHTYLSNFAFLSGIVYKHYEPYIVNVRLPYLKWTCILCLGLLTAFAMRFSDAVHPLYRFLWTFSFMALYATAPLVRVNRSVRYLNNVSSK